MPGPAPKPSHLRQRTNKKSTKALLPSVEVSSKRKVPPLPERESKAEQWHPNVQVWWVAVWKSPMAEQFTPADTHGRLFMLAELMQRRWTETDTKVLIALAAEIRQQEAGLGLSPRDRMTLQWEIEKGEVAAERTKARKKSKDLRQVAKKDPRELLKMVP